MTTHTVNRLPDLTQVVAEQRHPLLFATVYVLSLHDVESRVTL